MQNIYCGGGWVYDDDNLKYESGLGLFKHKIPMWIFLISLIGLTIWSFRENLSLIPLLD
jgi:hypothetical protein